VGRRRPGARRLGMRHWLRQTLEICERRREAAAVPSLAFLGPPGCGKTAHLSALYDALTSGEWREYSDCLMINLRELPVGASRDIFLSINARLIIASREIGFRLDEGAWVGPPEQRFGGILASWLRASPRNLLLFFDHLDSVPRRFSSDLKHHLRGLLDREDFNSTTDDTGSAQLGVVISGAVSLFELGKGEKSPFLTCVPVILPQQERLAHKHVVKEQAASVLRGAALKDEAVTYLAEATNGEPAFLLPLLRRLARADAAASGRELLEKTADALCSEAELNSIFWRLALHLWSDPEARRIVRRLQEGGDESPALDVDIDNIHLAGAVVVERRNGRSAYRFRNGLVESFLEKVIPYFDSEVPGARAARKAAAARGRRRKPEKILEGLRELDEAKSACAASDTLWEAVKYLKRAWKKTTPYHRSEDDVPTVNIYIADDDKTGWWVNVQRKEVFGPERQIKQPVEGDAVRTAVHNALEGRAEGRLHSFLGWSDSQLSLAVPLSVKAPYVFVVVTLPREQAGLDFTEFTLNYWTLFLQGDAVRRALVALTLAQLGEHTLKETSQAQPSAPAPRCDDARRLYWLDDHAIWVGDDSVERLSGRVEKSEAAYLMGPLRGDLIHEGDSRSPQRRLSHLRETFSHRLKTSLGNFKGLNAKLEGLKKTDELVVVTDGEGLMLPLELFPTSPSSFLSLTLPVVRQLYGVKARPDTPGTFPQLITHLQQMVGTLRALLIVSDPLGDLEASTAEVEDIKEIIKTGCKMFQLGADIEVIDKEAATLDNLHGYLYEKKRVDVFHYVGHGGAEHGRADRGGLLLRKADGSPHFVDSDALRNLVQDAHIWFAFINSCRSASPSERYTDPKGVGEALLGAGVPNFLGFREPISDASAKFFAEQFYAKLFPSGRADNVFDLGDAALAAREASARTEHADAWLSSLLLTVSR
jgi:CHAT domain/ATPase family associated with various cellular activities (AAA)